MGHQLGGASWEEETEKFSVLQKRPRGASEKTATEARGGEDVDAEKRRDTLGHGREGHKRKKPRTAR